MVMTQACSENLQSPRRSFLTEEQIFRLWRFAIKDDDKLVDEVIQHVYEQMPAHDHARFEAVMQLTIRRIASAGCAFRALLEDMRTVCGPARLNTNV
jgi:hypothetical protein